MLRYLWIFFVAVTPVWGTTSPVQPPLQNLTLAGPNGNLQLAVADNGMAVAVWTNFPNQIEVQAAFFNGVWWQYLMPNTNQGTLVNDQVIDGSTKAFGSSPRVGVDANGNATIVYVSPNNQIIANRYHVVPNTTNPRLTQLVLQFTTPLTTLGTNNSPTLAVNSKGSAIVVWIQVAPYQVLTRSFNAIPGNITWSQATTFMAIPPSTSSGAINHVKIPANSNGTYPGNNFGIGINPKTGVTTGVMVWTDGSTGAVRAGNFTVP